MEDDERMKAFRDGAVWGYDEASGTPPTAEMTAEWWSRYDEWVKRGSKYHHEQTQETTSR